MMTVEKRYWHNYWKKKVNAELRKRAAERDQAQKKSDHWPASQKFFSKTIDNAPKP